MGMVQVSTEVFLPLTLHNFFQMVAENSKKICNSFFFPGKEMRFTSKKNPRRNVACLSSTSSDRPQIPFVVVVVVVVVVGHTIVALEDEGEQR